MADKIRELLGPDGKPLKHKKKWPREFPENLVNFNKEKPELFLSILAFLVSFISLGFSIRNTYIFERQVSIEKVEYLSSINVIWRIEIDPEKEEIKIVATRGDITLQKGYIYFPAEFYEFREVYPPSYSFSIKPLSMTLESYVRERIKNQLKEDHYAVFEGSIPMIIESNYTVGGDSFSNKGIYAIRYIFYAETNSLYDSDINIEGVSYVGGLSNQDDGQTAVDMIWETWQDQ